MDCPNCQLENPENVKFCYECGHNFHIPSEATLQALSFNEKLEKIQRYLPRGLAEKILNQKDKIEGERKQVTVMFCDMVNFSLLVDRLGPEEAYYIMDQIYEILIHTVHEYEGIVNEMTGDGIMALFGAPIALEDAPHRALLAALSINHKIDRFSVSQKGIGSIKMRIGIHTGPVVVGTLGNDLRVEFKAVGNTVILASRMEELAEAGSIYVTEDTFKITRQHFQFQAIGKKSLRGRRESIAAYKVLSSKEYERRSRLGSERMIYSEMVGRDKELDRLELQVMKAINGDGSIVNIIGEAGIGKSRLVAELKKCDAMKRVTFLEGRTISIGRNLGFHPIIDILKQWARIKEDDGELTALGKLEAAIRTLSPEQVTEMLPFVATLMGMNLYGKYAERVRGIEGEALEKLILKNLRELLIKAAKLTPLVVVLEDLHWADRSSIELMESLFRLAETQKILFINVFRPGHSETGDRIIESIQERLPVYSVQVILEPLNEKMSEVLITNILDIGDLHHAVINKIVQRVDGNPFFIEEVVRSFIDSGAVILKNGSFQVTDKIRKTTIPNTINDVLMSRIDRLHEPTRDLVKVASVIGRNFFYRILKEVSGVSEDLDDRISYLKEIQLIREGRRMGEVEYLFKHALAQEVAYNSILPRKLRTLHLKVATSIEKVFEERLHEFFGMLAYHYSKAENLEKAEEFLVKAGEEALKSAASNEALHYYQEALELYLHNYGELADPDKVAMFHKNIALAFYNRGQYDEAVEYFDKTLRHYWGKLPENVFSATFKFISAFMHFIVALYLPALKFRKLATEKDNEIIGPFHKKCEALAVINPRRFFVESILFLKRVTQFDLSTLQSGLEMFMGASSLFSFTGLSFGISRKILHFADKRLKKDNDNQLILYDLLETIQHYFEGHWEVISNYNEDLVTKALNIGKIYSASHHLFWHGLPSIYQGSFETAESMVNKLFKIHEFFDNEVATLLKFTLNTSLLTEYRIINRALTSIEDGIEFAQKTNQGLSLIHMYSCKAQIQILIGDIEEADKSLRYADRIRSEIVSVPWQLADFRKGVSEYNLCCLEGSIKNGDKKKLSKYRRKAAISCRRLIKESQKVAQHRTESYRLMGLYFWLINKQKRALKWWNKSIKEGERLGARLELSRTYFEIGKRLLEAKSNFKKLDGMKAKEYIEKARVEFEVMNLQWDLDELNRLAGNSEL